MSKYGASTSVSTDRSRTELERTLARYGADEFVYGTKADCAMVGFKMNDRFVRFMLPLPNKSDREFTHTPGRELERTEPQAYKEWEQACRQRWRAMNLVVKAKLEAVESGITTFGEEFLAHLVLPSGGTVGDWIEPQLEEVYATKKMPALLPGFKQRALPAPKKGT